MIVRPGAGVLHLITQPDHAALARRIMEHWASLHKAERRREILTAIEHHDRAWAESDAAPTVDPATATIRDFIAVPAAVRQNVWPRSVECLAAAPWAAALVAHHALTVYDRYRHDPEWQDFFPGMTALRETHRARAGGDLKALVRDYVYVRLGDLISLAFCTGATAPASLGPWTIRLDGTHLHVTPSPFVLDVMFAIAAREIPDVPYPSDEALRAAVAAAPSRPLEGMVVVPEPAH
ncbi:MAG TPA: DUF3891 family protein [Vicinamibacterales bacterium]|nr:DUF3891 family protein [Vicinamibacterales bacterium]